MIFIRRHIEHLLLIFFLTVWVHTIAYTQNYFNVAPELALVKNQRAQVLSLDSKRLEIAGYLSKGELVSVEKTAIVSTL